LFLSFLVRGLRKNYSINFHKFGEKLTPWATEEIISFWW